MSASERAVALFAEAWGGWPTTLVRAPGRVNLIGDHTDHQDGLVLPMAVDRDTCLALRPRAGASARVVSEHERERATVRVPPSGSAQRGWAGYVEGTLWALAGDGHPLVGWDGAVASDLPVGAGLSSSAALELAVALGALAAADAEAPDHARLARLAQRAENEWVGMSCGIMDQLAVAAGESGRALMIDCRTLACRPVPLPAEAAVLVLDTGTRRELTSSAYNTRQRECQRAAESLGVASLRDADAETVARGRLPEALERRARHVVSENARVRQSAYALAAGDIVAFGRLMEASHSSLRDDFEASTAELEAIVEAAGSQPGCFGARLTGAGFGGCAVALVDAARAEGISAATRDAYRAATGRDATVHVCAAADGAAVMGGDAR